MQEELVSLYEEQLNLLREAKEQQTLLFSAHKNLLLKRIENGCIDYRDAVCRVRKLREQFKYYVRLLDEEIFRVRQLLAPTEPNLSRMDLLPNCQLVVTPLDMIESAVTGDMSCRFNAVSPFLRCAVNPKGDCEECRFYEQKEDLA